MAHGRFNEQNRLTPTCKSTFCGLEEPTGYKGDTSDRAWNIQVCFTPAQAETFLSEVTEIAKNLLEDERKKLKERNKTIRSSEPFIPYKTLDDGSVYINFKKKEKDGNAPPVLDYNRNPTSAKIAKGTRVQVAYNLKPYYMSSSCSFGISFQLIAVRTMEQDLPDEEIQAVFSSSKDQPILKETPRKVEPVNLDDLF